MSSKFTAEISYFKIGIQTKNTDDLNLNNNNLIFILRKIHVNMINLYFNLYALIAVRLVTRIRPSGAVAIPTGSEK